MLVRHSSHTTHLAGELFPWKYRRQHQQIKETSEVTVRGYWAGKTWPYLFLNITNQWAISRSSQCHHELPRSAQTWWPGSLLTNTALNFLAAGRQQLQSNHPVADSQGLPAQTQEFCTTFLGTYSLTQEQRVHRPAPESNQVLLLSCSGRWHPTGRQTGVADLSFQLNTHTSNSWELPGRVSGPLTPELLHGFTLIHTLLFSSLKNFQLFLISWPSWVTGLWK